MATDLLNASRVSATGLAAHRTKMNLIAQNLANVETTRTDEGGPYRRQMVIFKGKEIDEFETVLEKKIREEEFFKKHRVANIEIKPIELFKPFKPSSGTGVEVVEIVKSQEDFRLVYNPAHPDADPNTGYVKMPNVDHLTEVADMVVAKRAYEGSVTALSNTKSMILKALEIGKS
ncbi:MAG: flagellar basal body rod protein FlgC [Desulfamplus sp.]|nr:flagellar basal body rod protein FlgC [Desulfamplus sp.]